MRAGRDSRDGIRGALAENTPRIGAILRPVVATERRKHARSRASEPAGRPAHAGSVSDPLQFHAARRECGGIGQNRDKLAFQKQAHLVRIGVDFREQI
jgi:hypothetical protein